MDRVSVAEAAQRLGISQDAVYKRIKRGTIPWEKGTDDKTYVYIDESIDSPDLSSEQQSDSSTDALVDELRDRVRFLEDELRRKDTILMSLVQRIPELEPPRGPEPRESPVTASEEEAKGETLSEPERAESRPWWRKLFGG